MNKRQLLTLTVFTLISLSTFAQKNELKAAEKAVKKKDYSTALSAISQAESLIGAADAKIQAKYYYLKGISLYEDGSGTDVDAVITAFSSLIKVEKESGSTKYTNEVEVINRTILEKVFADATAAYELGQQNEDVAKYKEAAIGYEKMAIMSPKDTVYLYNSAVVFALAKEYEKSNELYQYLLDTGYTGIATEYTANRVIDGSVILYRTKEEMMKQIKLKLAENPKTKVFESKYFAIVENISWNYVGLDDNENALKFISEARKENPTDYNLIMREGNIYFKMGDFQGYMERIEEAIKLKPDEPNLYYTVGTILLESGENLDKAEENFKKAIELKPDFTEAYLNLGIVIMSEVGKVEEEMNANAANFKKYDEIVKNKRNPLILEALPFYEKAYELSSNSENSESLRKQINSYYEALGLDKKIE